MHINISDNYKLHDVEKYYVVNLLLNICNIKITKIITMKLASSVKSLGPQSIDELIKNTMDYVKKNSKFNEDVVIAVTPSIEYFFNEVRPEIRRKSVNIDIY
jgi:hypothetical protein